MAIAVVQSTQNSATAAGTTLSKAFASSVAAGNTLLVGVAAGSSTVTFTGVTDLGAAGNTFTAVDAPATMATNAFRSQWFICQNCNAGACTPQVTVSGSTTEREIWLFELSGAATSGGPDASAHGNGTGTGTYTVNVTTVAANALLLGITISFAATVTTVAGFTAGPVANGNPSESKAVVTPASTALSFSNGNSATWIISGISIAPASGVTTLSVNVSDSTSTSESVGAQEGPLVVGVSDSTTTSEHVAVSIQGAGGTLSVNVSDSTSLSESLSVGGLGGASVTPRSNSHLGYGSHTNPVITAPAGIVSGDALLLVGLVYNASGTAPVPTPPAGFANWPGTTGGQLESNTNFNGTGDNMALYAWVKIATGSEPGSYTITQAAGSSDYWMGDYEQVDNTTPASSSWTGNTGTNQTSTALSVTPTLNGSEVIIVSGDNGVGDVPIAVPGTTPTFTAEILVPVVLNIAAGTLATAAATGDKVFTNDNGPSSTEGWVTAMIVLNPTGAGPADLNIDVTDSTSTSENVAVQIPAGTLSISVSDSTSTSENVVVQEVAVNTLSVNVSDSTSTSEHVVVQEVAANTLSVNVSDSTSTSEWVVIASDPPLTFTLEVDVSDTVNTAEQGTIQEVTQISVSDSTSTSENVSVQESAGALAINVSDSTSTSENVQASMSALQVGVSDSTSTSEHLGQQQVSFISVSDSTSISENVAAVETGGGTQIGASDSTSVSEHVNVTISTAKVAVSDSTHVSELVEASQGAPPIMCQPITCSLTVPAATVGLISPATTTILQNPSNTTTIQGTPVTSVVLTPTPATSVTVNECS